MFLIFFKLLLGSNIGGEGMKCGLSKRGCLRINHTKGDRFGVQSVLFPRKEILSNAAQPKAFSFACTASLGKVLTIDNVIGQLALVHQLCM